MRCPICNLPVKANTVDSGKSDLYPTPVVASWYCVNDDDEHHRCHWLTH